MDRNVISQRQTDALKLETLRAYFDFREGRPTAETVAEKLGIPVRTVRDWLSDNRNGELLDELVPLWPNIGSARQFASEHVQEALQTMVELMRSGKSEKVRMDAAATLLALAGVRPVDGAVEEKPTQGEAQRPAVLLATVWYAWRGGGLRAWVVDVLAALLGFGAGQLIGWWLNLPIWRGGVVSPSRTTTRHGPRRT